MKTALKASVGLNFEKILTDYVKIFLPRRYFARKEVVGTAWQTLLKWLKLRTAARCWRAGAQYGWRQKRGAQRRVAYLVQRRTGTFTPIHHFLQEHKVINLQVSACKCLTP